MPELSNGPEADDLDAAFHGLVDDVGSRTRPPGADRAVRTARGRRARSAAGVVVLVVVLVVATGFGTRTLLGSRYDAVPVAATPSASLPAPSGPASTPADEVPPPVLVTPDRLDAASEGWTGWRQGTAEDGDVPSCWRGRDGSAPRPVETTTEHYRAQPDAGRAVLERERFASTADANLVVRATVEGFESCPAGTSSFFIGANPYLDVVAYTWGTGDRRGAVWFVGSGDRMDTLSVVGAPAPSDDVVADVARLLAADVRVG